MAETHQVITKVWIAPGCIVCDSCENDCPEVFDVQEETCVIRPPAASTDFLKPLTPSIIVAAEGCPVEVIKFATKEVEGPAPWAGKEAPTTASAPAAGLAHAPAKAAVPLMPADPKWQALLSTSKISPSLSAGLASTIRQSAEVNQAEEVLRAVNLPKNAPPDQRAAMLAVGGAYQPAPTMAERLRAAASKAGGKVSRRNFNMALAVAWGAMAACGLTFGAMFQDFFGPKVLKEPKKVYRVGRSADFGNPGVYEQYKPDGIWLVNLQPSENKLIALSTICTHLGCIPAWLQSDLKFKCPCHGSGYYITGVNFEGPTPRPLERFPIYKDPDGFINVDKSKVFRSELGQWDDPESFIPLA
ncbi:MAG TPA: Rieske 2Fe-2S domain-containing protein [Tepidisphaeraceae bacterium]|jgi:cytochrome b6-f complex iron-sulfur subunit